MKRIDVRSFPSSDSDFGAWVRELVSQLDDLSVRSLQDAIRARYPLAVVREQAELARRGEEAAVWYAFRQGTVTAAPSEPKAVDWEDPSIAWAIVDDLRTFVDLNDALASIVELPSEAIIGRTIDEFTNPDDLTAREDVNALWQEFLQARRAESSIRFNRLDGTPRQLAYRIVADEAGPGRHRLRVAEVERAESG